MARFRTVSDCAVSSNIIKSPVYFLKCISVAKMAVPLSHGFAEFLKKKYFWKSEKSTFAQKGACIFGKCEITIGIWGNKYFFQEYFFFTFHTEFSKFVLLEVVQWSQLLTPIRVGVMSSYSQMWKGDGHTTVRMRCTFVASIPSSRRDLFKNDVSGGTWGGPKGVPGLPTLHTQVI